MNPLLLKNLYLPMLEFDHYYYDYDEIVGVKADLSFIMNNSVCVL